MKAGSLGDPEPIPADLRDAFDRAVDALIAWDSGAEPTVNVHGRATLISAIASLVETYKDVMPPKLYWRLFRHANYFPNRRAQAAKLSANGSYETGARCLLEWVEENEINFGSPPVTSIEYEIELERSDGKTDRASATLPPQLTKGQRLKVPVGDGWVDAEVIEVTQLTSDEPSKWKLIARELDTPWP